MILERKKSVLAPTGEYYDVEVEFHGYPVKAQQDANGEVKIVCTNGFKMDSTLIFAELSADLFTDHIAQMKDGETRIVQLDSSVEREIRDDLFTVSLNRKIYSAEAKLDWQMYDAMYQQNLLGKKI